MNIASVQCDNDHDRLCVEQSIKQWLQQNQRINEATRFAIARLLKQAESFVKLQELLR